MSFLPLIERLAVNNQYYKKCSHHFQPFNDQLSDELQSACIEICDDRPIQRFTWIKHGLVAA